MDYLHNLDGTPRVQFKTPWVTRPSGGAKDGQKRGDNVTIIITESEGQKVYKEFCYYLRERDGFNYLMEKVEAADQRQPPPSELLNRLGAPYSSWSLNTYANERIKILVYDYIKGTHWPASKDGWIQVMKQVQTMHSLNFVHGDLLPRNLIFLGKEGYVIDFDLMREENYPYVSGYNSDFRPYRHKDAYANAEMKKEHDVWALAQMSQEYFNIPEKAIDLDEIREVSKLLEYFEKNDVAVKNLPPDAHFSEDATGSPVRDAVGSLTDRLGGMGVH
jgi:serine/threonine protein kinase